jgi:hypothetical protein
MSEQRKEHRQASWVTRLKLAAIIAVSFVGAFAILIGPQDLVETNLLAVLSTFFAGFCIWLAVRYVNRREQWVKWTAAVLVRVLVIYPLSFGPVHWYVNSRPLRFRTLNSVAGFYRPLQRIAGRVPLIDRSIRWYADLWSPEAPCMHYRSIIRTVKPSKKDARLFW